MPPKAKREPKKLFQSKSDGMVLLCKDDILKCNEENTPSIVKLRHPHTNTAAMFLFNADNTKVQELTSFSEENRSWFINESVRSDGRMFLSTPLNPVYLALPYLIKANTLSPLDQTLIDREYPQVRRLLKCLDAKLLSLVADRKGDADMNVWKYNEEKALAWLKTKVEGVVTTLQDRGVQVAPDGVAISNTFIKSKANTDSAQSKDTLLRYSHGIVSEYLPSPLATSLLSALGLPEIKPTDPSHKRKLLAPQSPNVNTEDVVTKRIKLETGESASEFKIEKQTPIKKPTQPSAKEKALARSASGTKSISSFFKKATK